MECKERLQCVTSDLNFQLSRENAKINLSFQFCDVDINNTVPILISLCIYIYLYCF